MNLEELSKDEILCCEAVKIYMDLLIEDLKKMWPKSNRKTEMYWADYFKNKAQLRISSLSEEKHENRT